MDAISSILPENIRKCSQPKIEVRKFSSPELLGNINEGQLVSMRRGN